MNMNMQVPMPPQQMQIPPGHVQPPPQTAVPHLDNIVKAKQLLGPLRESLANTIKTAANLVTHNMQTDVGGKREGVDSSQVPRFDKHLEDFFSICDQIELHLKTAKAVIEQTNISKQYMQLDVNLTRMEPINEHSQISYVQFLELVKRQINYAKEIHDILICASQNISPSEGQ